MKIGTFMRGMVVGVATGVLLDTALRPSPKFRKTQAGKAMHRLSCALDEAVEASSEPEMRVVYRKLNEKLAALKGDDRR